MCYLTSEGSTIFGAVARDDSPQPNHSRPTAKQVWNVHSCGFVAPSENASIKVDDWICHRPPHQAAQSPCWAIFHSHTRPMPYSTYGSAVGKAARETRIDTTAHKARPRAGHAYARETNTRTRAPNPPPGRRAHPPQLPPGQPPSDCSRSSCGEQGHGHRILLKNCHTCTTSRHTFAVSQHLDQT